MLEMKPWYQSKTVWGALIAIAAPLLGHAGLQVGGAEQAEIADALTTLAGTLGCTHLNDVLRAFADIPSLARLLKPREP